MYFVNNTLSQTKWYHDSFTLEHNTILNLQFLPEVKVAIKGGGTAVKFSGQPSLITVVNNSSSTSVSVAAFSSDNVT